MYESGRFRMCSSCESCERHITSALTKCTDVVSIPRTLVYVSDAVFFLAGTAACVFFTDISSSESLPPTSLLSALSSWSARTFLLILGFVAALVVVAFGFAALGAAFDLGAVFYSKPREQEHTKIWSRAVPSLPGHSPPQIQNQKCRQNQNFRLPTNS